MFTVDIQNIKAELQYMYNETVHGNHAVLFEKEGEEYIKLRNRLEDIRKRCPVAMWLCDPKESFQSNAYDYTLSETDVHYIAEYFQGRYDMEELHQERAFYTGAMVMLFMLNKGSLCDITGIPSDQLLNFILSGGEKGNDKK